MKHPHFAEKEHSNPTPFSLRDVSTNLAEKSFDVTPLNVSACGMGENCVEGALGFSLHSRHGTTWRYHSQISRWLLTH